MGGGTGGCMCLHTDGLAVNPVQKKIKWFFLSLISFYFRLLYFLIFQCTHVIFICNTQILSF